MVQDILMLNFIDMNLKHSMKLNLVKEERKLIFVKMKPKWSSVKMMKKLRFEFRKGRTTVKFCEDEIE
ncbi:7628_t:CDS:2 [Ambispora leptoticha]|uniref:7628_t:CDS:1 n=1 Tax=Ambispora leptoticha TaxID=144679 RepID=A0A9N9AYE7_9GLOM|nr:7628_t:CDS:2 [Ambispora leptoticha]